MNFGKKLIPLAIFITTIAILLTACGGEVQSDTTDANTVVKPTIKIGQPPWNAAYYIDAVAQVIIEEGFGYPVEIVDASNPAVLTAMSNHEIDIHMNVWRNAYVPYQEMLEEGKLVQLNILHHDAVNGIYVPEYIIHGDSERNIEAVAPDLKTVKDLAKYADLFPDPDDPSKGVFINAPTDMTANPIFAAKLEAYGLLDYYNITVPGSQSAMEASLEAAYERGEPWVGYSYTPTWVQSKFKMVKLEEDSYDPALYTEEAGYICDFPPEEVVIAADTGFKEKAPDVFSYLETMTLSGQHVSDMLWYMKKENVDGQAAAIYWMKENTDEWLSWIPEDIGANVKAFLDTQK